MSEEKMKRKQLNELFLHTLRLFCESFTLLPLRYIVLYTTLFYITDGSILILYALYLLTKQIIKAKKS